MTVKVVPILFVFLLKSAIAQVIPQFAEGYNYGGSSVEYSKAFKWTFDSTLIQAGNTWSNDFDIEINKGLSDFWLLETDTLGNILKEKTFGGSSIEVCNDFIQTPDSGFIFIGYTYSTDGDISEQFGSSDFWVVRTDRNLNLIWEKTYGGSDEDWAYSIVLTQDDNLVIGGITNSNDGIVTTNYGVSDFLLIKININGDLLWAKNYGGSNEEKLYQILETESGELILAGDTYSSDFDIIDFNGNSDYFIIKTDSNGNLLSSYCYGSNNYEKCRGIALINSNIVLVGRISDLGGDIDEYLGGFYDIWVICINDAGLILWQNTLGGTRVDEGYNIVADNINSLLISGYTTSNDIDITNFYSIDPLMSDYWVVNLDTSGIIKWQISLGGSYSDFATNGLADKKGNYYISGYVGSADSMVEANHGLYDIWLAKLKICEAVKYYVDEDSDGYGNFTIDSISCFNPLGYVLDSTDCNDLNPEIHPTLADICNAIDDNCNGLTDEDATFVNYFADIDGDNFGDVSNDSSACNELIGYVLDNSDCNDSNNAIYPGATELCNYLDDDCDGITDDNVTFIQSFIDADNDNFGNPDLDSIACEIPPGYVLSNTDCNDTNPDIYPGAPELLNGLDDDCDQIADEGLAITDIVKSTISIYPNPVNAVLFIQSNESQKITIINQLGETILFANLLIGLNTISVADFASDVYWVKAENGKMVVWVKQ